MWSGNFWGTRFWGRRMWGAVEEEDAAYLRASTATIWHMAARYQAARVVPPNSYSGEGGFGPPE